MLILEDHSSFSLYRDYSLSERDRQVLSLLYLPIRKSDSFSLYSLLYDLSFLTPGNGYFFHDDLLSQLDREPSRFLLAREKLEGIGLRETFRKKKRGEDNRTKVNYLYRLLPPASPKKFFGDIVLKSLLISEVGNKKYFSLRNYFKIPDGFKAEEKENVTSSFKEAFPAKLEGDESLLLSGDGLSEKNYKSPVPSLSLALNARLAKDNFPRKSIAPYVDEISSLASLYGVNRDDLCKRIEGNTDTDGKFFRDSFRKAVRNYIDYGRKNVTREETPLSGSTPESRFIEAFQKITPKQYLTERFNASPAPFRLTEVESLRSKFGFDNAIINAILDYSLRKTKNEFNQSYREKVAFKLSSYHVSSVYEARATLKSRDFEAQRSLGRKKKEERKAETSSGKEEVSRDELEGLTKDLGL